MLKKSESSKKPHTVKKPNHMEQVYRSHREGTGRRDSRMRWDERTHEGQTEKGHQAEAAEQSKAKPGKAFGGAGLRQPRSREAQRSRTRDVGGREHATGVRGHTHTHRHTATLGSLHNVNEVVCAQRLFPSCIWEVNTRVWAQSPGQPLQLAKERPCFLQFGVYVCVLKTQNQKEKQNKTKDRGQKWTVNPEIPSRFWGTGIGYRGFGTAPQ